VQIATSGVANQLQQPGLQIALSIATYIISSGMSVSGLNVQGTNLVNMSLPTRNTDWRDHNRYRMLSAANMKAGYAEVSLRHVHRGFNVFLLIPCIVSDLPKPNHLHTMEIRMLDHLQKWIFDFMKMQERLDKYNAIWLSMPPYHDLTPRK
jgi:hypothetical protein